MGFGLGDLGTMALDFGKTLFGGAGGAEGTGSLYQGMGSDGKGFMSTTGGEGMTMVRDQNGAFTQDFMKTQTGDQLGQLNKDYSFQAGKEGTPFDFNTTINNASKLGNMYSTWQDQKMKKEYFNEWKKNNAYMKAEAEAQKEGKQGLANEVGQ